MSQKLQKNPISSLFSTKSIDIFHRKTTVSSMENTGAIIGLLILVIIFSFLSESFRQVSNLVLLLKSAAITIGIVAVGQTVVMIAGGIDLSVSSVIAFSGIISASLMKYGLGPIMPMEGNYCYLAIFIGWLMGSMIGATQGYLITHYQMPAFIVTLGTMVGLRGLSVALSNSAPINSLPDQFKWFSDGRVGIIPAPVVIMLIVYISTAIMLKYTKMGRYCHAIGGNETAARLAGISVDRYRIGFYAYSGFLAALTGTILISYIDAAVYTNGDGFQFNSVAAAIIGGTSLTGGIGGLSGTLIGSLILATIPSGMVMLNVPSYWRDSVTGLVILLAVFIDVNRQHARKNAIRLDTIQSSPGGHYLADILGQLTNLIKKTTGSSLCRIYMIDRETNDVVPQDVPSIDSSIPRISSLPGKSRIVLEAQTSGNAVVIPDLARTGYQSVVPIQSDVQCALAFPMINQERCIGIIELQSPGIAVFKDTTIETIREITRPSLVPLEDAWLFENGWLIRQVRDALRHLWDDLYLGRIPMIEWAFPEHEIQIDLTPGERGEVLRKMLIKTIESLKTGEESDNRGNRSYSILNMTYIKEQSVEQIVRMSHISRRQYFYELKNSIEILTDLLIRNHGKSSQM